MSVERFDAIVIGAGPAGAAAALALRRRRPDAAVLLLDRATFPRDKSCGDAVSPDGVAELDRLGARDVLDGYPPVTRVRLRSPDGKQTRGMPTVDGYVVPRVVLDQRLVDHAVAAGAELRHERVRAVEQQGEQVVVNDRWAAPVVVGADGANSIVRRKLAVKANRASHTMIAIRAYAEEPVLAREFFIGWAPWGGLSYSWAFPVLGNRVNIGYGGPIDRVTGNGAADLETELRKSFPKAVIEPGTPRAHHLPLSSDRPQPYVGRVLLAGDAASLINPLTGEGIFYAYLSGRLAAMAITDAPQNPGPHYARLLQRALGQHFRHTKALAWASQWPRFLDGVVGATEDPATMEVAIRVAFGKGVLSPGVTARVARSWWRQHRV